MNLYANENLIIFKYKSLLAFIDLDHNQYKKPQFQQLLTSLSLFERLAVVRMSCTRVLVISFIRIKYL